MIDFFFLYRDITAKLRLREYLMVPQLIKKETHKVLSLSLYPMHMGPVPQKIVFKNINKVPRLLTVSHRNSLGTIRLYIAPYRNIIVIFRDLGGAVKPKMQ